MGPTVFQKTIAEIGLLNRAALRSPSLFIRIERADFIGGYSVAEKWVLAICNPFFKDLQGLQALRMEILFLDGTFFEIQKVSSRLTHKAALDISDVLTSLPLETVEAILMDSYSKIKKEDRHLYLKGVKDHLIEGFTPNPAKTSYRPPRIQVIWEQELESDNP